MTIDLLVNLPARTQAPAVFNANADALFPQLNTMAAQMNAAAAAYDVALWVSGTTYAIDMRVYSPIDFQVYIRKVAGAGVTDPSADSTNWALLGLSGGNMTGGLNELMSTVASAASPTIFGTSIGNVINYTGTATATGFAAAPQAGARRTLVCAGACVFTAGANMLIDGVASGSSYTCSAGDRVDVIAVTTTQFRLRIEPAATPADSMDKFDLAASAATNALTLTLKAGSVINFRSATLTTGTRSKATLAADVSVVLSNGSTLGFTAAQKSRIYIGAMLNGGAVEVLAYHANTGSAIKGFNEEDLMTTTAEGGAGAADSAATAYSTTARASLPWRLVGYVEITTGATPGQWANQPVKVQPMHLGVRRHGDVVQRQYGTSGGSSTTATSYTDVTTATLSITPTSDINKVAARYSFYAAVSNNATFNTSNEVILNRSGTTAGDQFFSSASGGANTGHTSGAAMTVMDAPATTSALTYKLQQKGSGAGGGETCTVTNIKMELEEIFA